MSRLEQLRALRRKIRSTRSGRLTLQIIVGIVGCCVVALGIVLIPFPGPGWLIVLGGLAILAIEFVWARRLLAFTRSWLERWWTWLGRQHWTVRLLAGAAGLVFVATVVWISLRIGLGIRTFRDLWDYITSH